MGIFKTYQLYEDQALTAGMLPLEKDLTVNPLSHLAITIKAKTLTANTLPTLANLLAVLTNVEVIFKTSGFISMSLADLFRYSGYVLGRFPRPARLNDDVNHVTWITVILPFGRKLWDMKECFPPTSKGDLALKLSVASSFTNITGVLLAVEQFIMPDATPEQFVKAMTKTKTPTATGWHEVDFPIGNPIFGALLFGTTVPTGTSWDASIARLSVLLDETEAYNRETPWEHLHLALAGRIESPWDFGFHTHLENLGATYAQNAESGPPSDAESVITNYGLLDFDPQRNDEWILETAGRGRVHLNIYADVADAIRVIPMELIKVAAA